MIGKLDFGFNKLYKSATLSAEVSLGELMIFKQNKSHLLLLAKVDWLLPFAEGDSCESVELLWNRHSNWEQGDFLV